MTATHLLDTDVAIEILRRRDPSLQERLRDHPDVALSSVSAMELFYGSARSEQPGRNAAAVEQFLGHVEVLEFGLRAAMHAGEIRAHLTIVGTPIGAYDVMIAGQARSLGLVVVTRNCREFDRVPGLRVQRW